MKFFFFFSQKTGFDISCNCLHWTVFVCVEVLWPVNPMGSCRAWSVYLTTHLLDRLSPLSIVHKPLECNVESCFQGTIRKISSICCLLNSGKG